MMKYTIARERSAISRLLALVICALLITSCGYISRLTPSVPVTTAKCLPKDCFVQALEYKRSNLPEQAYTALRAIKADYPDTEWSVRASYLLGLAALEDGKGGQAVPFLIEAIKLPVINDHVLFNLAQAYDADGQHTLAAGIYGSIITLSPDTVLIKSVKYKRAEAFFKAGSYAQARLAFSEFCDTYPDDKLAIDALIATARASILLGEPQSAILPLHKLFVHHPSFNASSQAAAEVDSLIAALKSVGISIPELTQDELFLRAEALFAAQMWKEAASAYKKIVSPAWQSASVLRSAEAMQNLKRYAASEEILTKHINSVPASSIKPRAMFLLVTALIRQDKADALKRLIQGKVFRNLPLSAELVASKLSAARYLDETNTDEQKTAMTLYMDILDSSGSSDKGREAAWAIGWRNYRDGLYTEAERFFSIACDQQAPRCLYWSGRASEKAGLLEPAVRYYQMTCSASPTSYYCGLASKRAPVSAAASPAEPVQTVSAAPDMKNEQLRFNLLTDNHYLAAEELKLLGLDGSAGAELDLLSKRYSTDAAAALALSNLFYESGDIYRGLRTWRLYLSTKKGTQPYALSQAYPVQALELAAQSSDAKLTDPYLVTAIMREESAFNPEAVSPAGAMGMMQLMPSTARFIANKTSAPEFKTDELLSNSVNIRLGSRYLDYLLETFNGNLIQAVAAYNAGPGAVKSWLQRYPAEPDEFIESIPFPETRNYTKRVIETYNLYQHLSESIPKNVSSVISLDSGRSAQAAY